MYPFVCMLTRRRTTGEESWVLLRVSHGAPCTPFASSCLDSWCDGMVRSLGRGPSVEFNHHHPTHSSGIKTLSLFNIPAAFLIYLHEPHHQQQEQPQPPHNPHNHPAPRLCYYFIYYYYSVARPGEDWGRFWWANDSISLL